MQTAVLAPPEQRAVQRKAMKSTMHRQKVRFHVLYADFEDICAGDVRLAHALRLGESQTDQRIASLRVTHGIPETHMPADDDLWFTMTYRMAEVLTLHALSRSTCQRIFSEAEEGDGMPSLIDLGFLRRRYVARRGPGLVTRPEHATIYQDEDGEFIIVDECGEYLGNDERRYSAMSDGYTVIGRQYLYCFDAVNAAIAEYDGLEAPLPSPRWEPTIAKWEPGGKRKRQKKSAEHYQPQETTKSPSFRSSDAAKNDDDTAQKGTNHISDDHYSFEKQNNTTRLKRPYHLLRNTLNFGELRKTALNSDVILALSALVLDIPTPPDPDDEEACAAYERDWAEPSRRLYAATLTLPPVRAWERVDLTTRYMATPGSPSWWQREADDERGGRKTKMPITLKNVADRFVFEYDEYCKQRAWSCPETTPYDGQALEYEQGYTAESAAIIVEEAPPAIESNVVEVVALPIDDEPFEAEDDPSPRQACAMGNQDLIDLAQKIMDEYPEAQLSTLAINEAKTYLAIALGPDEWFNIDIVIWRVPLPSEEALLERAMAYGAQLLTEQAQLGQESSTDTQETT